MSKKSTTTRQQTYQLKLGEQAFWAYSHTATKIKRKNTHREQTTNTATHSTKTKANTANTLMHYLEPEDTDEWPWETHNRRPYRGAPRPCEITTGCHYRCLLCSWTQKG